MGVQMFVHLVLDRNTGDTDTETLSINTSKGSLAWAGDPCVLKPWFQIYPEPFAACLFPVFLP